MSPSGWIIDVSATAALMGTRSLRDVDHSRRSGSHDSGSEVYQDGFEVLLAGGTLRSDPQGICP